MQLLHIHVVVGGQINAVLPHLLSLPTVPSYCSFPKRFSDENNCFLLRSANFTALNATWQITVAAAHGTGTYISIKTNFNDYQDILLVATVLQRIQVWQSCFIQFCCCVLCRCKYIDCIFLLYLFI